MKQLKKLILASQSPRRSEILKKAGYQFASFPVYVSEIPNKNLSVDEQILDIAGRKAEEAAKRIIEQGQDTQNSVILTADTMVCINDLILGKPENKEQARQFLSLLSGNTHQVKTAVVLLDLSHNEILSHIETSYVRFKKLSKQEIEDYIETGEPMDKAGAYGIQGKGNKLVESFDGDFNNVVGLPLQALEILFKLKGWEFLKSL